MKQNTIISSPSIADIDSLYSMWLLEPENAGKTKSEFYSFLTKASLQRSQFLSKCTVEKYDDPRGKIVVLKLTLKE